METVCYHSAVECQLAGNYMNSDNMVINCDCQKLQTCCCLLNRNLHLVLTLRVQPEFRGSKEFRNFSTSSDIVTAEWQFNCKMTQALSSLMFI